MNTKTSTHLRFIALATTLLNLQIELKRKIQPLHSLLRQVGHFCKAKRVEDKKLYSATVYCARWNTFLAGESS